MQLRTALTSLLATAALFAVPSIAAAAPTITAVAPASVVAGTKVVVSGTLVPAAPVEQVRLEQNIAGVWSKVGADATAAATGAWSVAFFPKQSGALRAVQLTAANALSVEAAVAVQPRVISAKLTSGTPYPFLGTSATWRFAPGSVTNGTKVTAYVSLGGTDVGTARGTIVKNAATLKLPTNGVGSFRVRLEVPASAAFAATSSTTLKFRVKGARVGAGSSAVWVKSLRAALKFRGFHVPNGSRFDARYGDSVIAFHKAYNRGRTTTFEASDWKRLTAKRVMPRNKSKALHIEIDKSRQILMMFKNGKAIKIVHVSTGSTGNTPVGNHKIQWKGNWVPSLYGSLLYKSMAFQGTFAIHGYPSVPTSPASHGCVRVPMWIAASLYAASPVGTPVLVYAGPGSTGTSVGKSSAAVGADVPELTGVDVARYADEI